MTERVFADPSILDAIASDPLVPRQDEGAGGSAPPPRQKRRKGFSESPQLAQSRLCSSPHQRLSKRAQTRPRSNS
jgi:hypothetical protein